jgi:hypothetical protein
MVLLLYKTPELSRALVKYLALNPKILDRNGGIPLNQFPDALFTALLFITTVAVAFSLFYLVRNRSESQIDDRESRDLSDIANKISEIDKRHSENLKEELGEITRELTDLRGEIANYQLQVSGWEKVFQNFIRRMDRERARLRTASVVNLLIGLLFSLIALYLIGQLVTYQPVELTPPGAMSGSSSWLVVAQKFIPRLSLGLLIQLVGFFFLRLYVTNELDLKHTKNELTNFDAWMIAVLLAKDSSDDVAVRKVIDRMTHVERNFVLKKNEHTVGVEADTKYNDLVVIVRDLIAKFPTISGSSEGAD